MVKIANFVRDEKFIDGMIECQDITNNIVEHTYILVRKESINNFKYIKKTDRIIVINNKKVIEYLDSGKFDAVFLHSLYSLPLCLIPKIPQGIKVFWFAWGYDIYKSKNYPGLINKRLYGEKTIKIKRPIVEAISSRFNICGIKCVVLNIVNFLFHYKEKRYQKAIPRIDFFSGVLPIEFDLIPKGKYGFRAGRVEYFYTSIQSLTSNTKYQYASNDASNILIGNSATQENNHIEAFRELSKLDLSGRKIIVPLSYGESWYRNYILKEGNKYFGENFYPLVEFIPYIEYQKIIDSCCMAIFHHERQQGIGNISMSLRKGLKVFLSETSVAYNYYKSIGITLYSVQRNLSATNIECEDKEIAEENIDILNNRFSVDYYRSLLVNIYNLIQNS